jgi:hypothetical protein
MHTLWINRPGVKNFQRKNFTARFLKKFLRNVSDSNKQRNNARDEHHRQRLRSMYIPTSAVPM